MSDTQKPLNDLARSIKGIVLDVDGVLTDGKIIYGSDGREQKHFHGKMAAASNCWHPKALRLQSSRDVIPTSCGGAPKNWAFPLFVKEQTAKPRH